MPSMPRFWRRWPITAGNASIPSCAGRTGGGHGQAGGGVHTNRDILLQDSRPLLAK